MSITISKINNFFKNLLSEKNFEYELKSNFYEDFITVKYPHYS